MPYFRVVKWNLLSMKVCIAEKPSVAREIAEALRERLALEKATE